MDYTIYHKPQEEIDGEMNERQVYAKMVKGLPEPVCPIYVKTKTGENIDVWGLTPLQLYAFVKKAHESGAEHPFEILKHITDKQKINDYSTWLDFTSLVSSEGELMRDFIGGMGGNMLKDKAREIAKYKTEVEGQPTTCDEVIAKIAHYERQKNNEST